MVNTSRTEADQEFEIKYHNLAGMGCVPFLDIRSEEIDLAVLDSVAINDSLDVLGVIPNLPDARKVAELFYLNPINRGILIKALYSLSPTQFLRFFYSRFPEMGQGIHNRRKNKKFHDTGDFTNSPSTGLHVYVDPVLLICMARLKRQAPNPKFDDNFNSLAEFVKHTYQRYRAEHLRVMAADTSMVEIPRNVSGGIRSRSQDAATTECMVVLDDDILSEEDVS
jgi:hypothetical protein